MPSIDQHTTIFPDFGINITASAGAETVGNIIDTQGFESCEFVISMGTSTSGTFTPTIEQSDNALMPVGDETTDVTADFLLGTVANATFTDGEANANTIRRIGTISKQRYQRITIDGTLSPTGTQLTVLAVLGHFRHQPTAGS